VLVETTLDGILPNKALYFSSMAQQPLVGQGLLVREASRSHSVKQATLGRTPLYEGSAHRRDLYLTTLITNKRKTSIPPTGFEPEILASERPQTHALDSAATGIGGLIFIFINKL
jgi:hypothetical protein